jgi:hypothetical protein
MHSFAINVIVVSPRCRHKRIKNPINTRSDDEHEVEKEGGWKRVKRIINFEAMLMSLLTMKTFFHVHKMN